MQPKPEGGDVEGAKFARLHDVIARGWSRAHTAVVPGVGEPLSQARSFGIERLDRRAAQAGQVVLDREADSSIADSRGGDSPRETRERVSVERQPSRRDRPGPSDPSRRSAAAARCPSARRFSRKS